jgi:hypothetical protein
MQSQRREKEGIDRLTELLAGASSSAKRVADILRSGSRPSVDIVKEGTKLLEDLDHLRQEDLAGLIENERVSMSKAVETWGDGLRQFCLENGMHLAGAFPDFIVAGVVYVKVQPSTFTAVINDKKLPAVPSEAAFKEIKSVSVELTRTSKSPQATIATLEAAYEAVVKEKTASGQLSMKRASLFELLPKVAFLRQDKSFLRNPVREKFASYSIHNLRADLFLLMQQDHPVEHRGRRLIVEPTSVAEQGLFMFIPALQRCGYVGHISFVGVGSEN